jgi:serine protease Do
MGPYIQHTAQVDSGNSGGPLLIAQRNAPSGYAVAGVNTLSGVRRQAANYAIPVNTLQTFINNALNPKPETFKANLDALLEKFVKGLGVNAAVYPHISDYLSTVCIGENAEYAFEEMSRRASTSVKRAFIEKSREDLISAMGVAVAWTIENSIRSGTGSLKTSIKEISGNGDEYAVLFSINNKDVKSVWIREYGNWRIKSFGTVATGDKELLSKRQKERETAEKLHTDNSLYIEAGYANLFDKANSALYLSLDVIFAGFNFYYVNSDFYSIGGFLSLHFPIPAGNIAFIPNFKFGFAYNNDSDYGKATGKDIYLVDAFYLSFALQGGLKITTSYVPGLYGNIGFQYNIPWLDEEEYKKPFQMAFTLSVGYAY